MLAMISERSNPPSPAPALPAHHTPGCPGHPQILQTASSPLFSWSLIISTNVSEINQGAKNH